MNEIIKHSGNFSASSDKSVEFKGYTIDELRYQRALTAVHKEFAKQKLLNIVNDLQKNNPFTIQGAVSSIPGTSGKIVGKLLSGLNYLDYAMIGFSVFGTVRKVFKFFRKK